MVDKTLLMKAYLFLLFCFHSTITPAICFVRKLTKYVLSWFFYTATSVLYCYSYKLKIWITAQKHPLRMRTSTSPLFTSQNAVLYPMFPTWSLIFFSSHIAIIQHTIRPQPFIDFPILLLMLTFIFPLPLHPNKHWFLWIFINIG